MARLQRTLSLGSVVLFGIAYMTPIIVLGTFGILAQSTAGMVPAAYLAALVAMFFTAMSYGRMAAAFPVAGSAYSYVRKAISPKLGFIAGWAVLLDYLFLPMAIWLIGAAYLASAFPSIPQWIWVLAFIGITSAINIIGLKLANGINALLMLVQFLVLIAFVALCVHYVGGDASTPLWSIKPFFNGDMQMPLIMSGAAIACYSFLGFDAVSTLTEETRDPRRTIPRAIMLITLIGGLIFVGVSYFVQIAHPSFQFDSVDSAAYEIARNIGGDLFVSIFLIGLIVGQFASGLSAQASGSRLLFAMGRDGVLPKSFFGTLHARFGTPVNSILLCAVVALLALKLDVTTSTSFINFGAFLAFSLVNLSVIFHYWIGGDKKGLRELVLFLVFPFIGLLADLWLMVSLDHLAVYLGLSWLAIGVLYLAVLTGGFRRQPPEMDFQEAA
ncbi:MULTISPECIES: APC family permease [Pseudomonas]|uniref:Amino acid permease n=1 Tax=Pseudomonas fluorescens TaxID=294 RepID=A0AAE2DLF0_PSEFL|nr:MULTISPECIES: APC family permease [Pseudomonas]KIF63060.1 amino acid permease [Pseudomonas fluorescens]MBP4001323.1 APC family permease [Pseudomonas koreensis]TFA85956.1 amino acid/polyamine/organocation transporter (APC superfamily) [Pseudomonas sp. LAIL14HWK12:I2]SCZ20952.1 amino acid/polyamine/organocation transporter, APC superfamily [Pseudomonas sp. NFIX46]SDB18069.1 amino acid/polyamine/organocation transporter, APC superfamily [Pseudomonas putida]